MTHTTSHNVRCTFAATAMAACMALQGAALQSLTFDGGAYHGDLPTSFPAAAVERFELGQLTDDCEQDGVVLADGELWFAYDVALQLVWEHIDGEWLDFVLLAAQQPGENDRLLATTATGLFELVWNPSLKHFDPPLDQGLASWKAATSLRAIEWEGDAPGVIALSADGRTILGVETALGVQPHGEVRLPSEVAGAAIEVEHVEWDARVGREYALRTKTQFAVVDALGGYVLSHVTADGATDTITPVRALYSGYDGVFWTTWVGGNQWATVLTRSGYEPFLSFGARDARNPLMVDWFGSGLQDLLLPTGPTDEAWVLQNQGPGQPVGSPSNPRGAPTFWLHPTGIARFDLLQNYVGAPPPSPPFAAVFAAADFDHDGDLELIGVDPSLRTVYAALGGDDQANQDREGERAAVADFTVLEPSQSGGKHTLELEIELPIEAQRPAGITHLYVSVWTQTAIGAVCGPRLAYKAFDASSPSQSGLIAALPVDLAGLPETGVYQVLLELVEEDAGGALLRRVRRSVYHMSEDYFVTAQLKNVPLPWHGEDGGGGAARNPRIQPQFGSSGGAQP